MQLTFKKAQIKKLVKQATDADGLALMLVGDQGVYLMPEKTDSISEPWVICYANECNPDNDGWWEAKRNSFGPDDGVERIPLTEQLVTSILERDGEIKIELSPTEFKLIVEEPNGKH